MDEWKTYMILFVFVIPIGFVILGVIIEHQRMQYYWRRGCMGRAWRRAFPVADKDMIRSFLSVFIDAFGFKKKHRLCFSPTDRIVDIYKIANPPCFSLGTDGLELETYALAIEKRFNIDIFSCWHNTLTFGELFTAVVHKKRTQ
ncbi:MAG: hypothetical protein JW709_04305 [Sedimentisphaerales bacterium]|nr:hypothetical protein [Sedimentisphaerales bacterium]